MKIFVFLAALCALAAATPFDPQSYEKEVVHDTTAMPLVDMMNSMGLTTLTQLIDMAGLTETLNTGGPFTIFAPTNEGLAIVPAWVANNKTLLIELLEAHVVSGKVMTTMLKDNMMATTLVNGISIRVNTMQTWQYTQFTASGKMVIDFDRTASNGIIHVIESVIYPLPRGNMIEAMEMIPGLSITLDLIKKAGLTSALTGAGPFTLFAPDNLAWSMVPEKNLTMIVSNKTLLTEVLSYHVAPGAFYTMSMRPGTLVTALDGNKILYNPKKEENMIFMNECRATVPDQTVMNGVVWVMSAPFPKPHKYW